MEHYEHANIERKNVLILGLCEALVMSMNSILLTIDPLIGYTLVDEKSQATAPIALFQIAGMLATFPASFSMKRFGRRWGFILGVSIGIVGAGVGIYGISHKSIVLFCISTFLIGFYNGFSGFYRFAAADAVRESHRSRAISWVIAGGILAALIGPLLLIWTQNMVSSQLFVGPFVSIMLLQVATLFLLFFLDIPKVKEVDQKQDSKPTIDTIKQPKFIISLLGGICSYGAMALVMTAAPLAMTMHQHSIDNTAFSMQAHLLGMFAPSLFTGQLIARFNPVRIMVLGVAINLISVVINTAELSLLSMCFSLFFLGLGWNFIFISATTLLTEIGSSKDQAMIQAIYEFVVLVFVATVVYASGWIMDKLGWTALNLISVPILFILLITIGLAQQQKRYLKA
jgi:MFS family permease